MLPKLAIRWPLVFLASVLLVDVACSSNGTPTSPSSSTSPSATPTPAAPPPPPSTAGRTGSVTVTANPNPVPFSGKPITDIASCAKRNNTWYYENVLQETGGVDVTFHSQQDWFDGSLSNDRTGLKIVVPANQKISSNVRWCSSTNSKHTAQSNFTGVDANGNSVSVKGPMVNLMAP